MCSLKGRFHHLRPSVRACGVRSRALISHFILSLCPRVCICVSRRRRVCCQSIAVAALDQLFTLLQCRITETHKLSLPLPCYPFSRCLRYSITKRTHTHTHKNNEQPHSFYNRVLIFHYFRCIIHRQHQSSSSTARCRAPPP